MRKPKEIEELVKRAIRDEIALHPLKSVAQVRGALFKQGYQALNGPLDWHYIARLMKKIRQENVQALTNQGRDEHLANLKERHRVITQKLADILDGKPISTTFAVVFPTHADRVAAANTILKWDMAMFFAEDQITQLRQEPKTNLVILHSPSYLDKKYPMSRSLPPVTLINKRDTRGISQPLVLQGKVG